MGAISIVKTFEEKLNEENLCNILKEIKEQEFYENGLQDGYSGDFQTVETFKLKNKIFDNYDDALDYCLDNAQKWDYVIATYYKKGEDTHTIIAGWGAC